MKATIEFDGIKVIYEGEADEVNNSVDLLVEILEGQIESFDDRLCRACKYDAAPSNGAEACLDCPGNERFEPKLY